MLPLLLLLLAAPPPQAAQRAMRAAATAAKATGCDPAIQRHVYHPARLKVYARCIAVTGIIVDATHGKRRDGARREKDGDTHSWINLDPPFVALLNSGNRDAQNNQLVFEVICYWTPTQQSAIGSCRGYANRVALPPVGSHVEILGVYVQDSLHAKWMELHSVTRISVIP